MKVELLKLETEHNIFEINNFGISITINYLIPIIVCTFSIKWYIINKFHSIFTNLIMKVQVYFFIEAVEVILIRNNKTSDQVLFSLYVLVWELKFKNILNVGRILVKLKKE